MPIIINGGSRRAGGWWAKHLTNTEQNERAELVEMRGVTAESVGGAFAEMRALATGTKCTNYFYQANINPRADEHLTPEQWGQAVDTLERNLGLTGQPRFVIEHEKGGRTHRHVVWSRIDVEHQRAIPDSLTAQIHEQTSRELEIAFDLERGKSILVPDRDFERPERGPQKWETFRGQRHGIDPRTITEELTGLWQGTDSGRSFKTAIEERGYILAQGDRRDFVVLDEAADVHSLARRIEGAKAKDIRERLADLDRSTLPSVDEAKAQIEARRHADNYYDRDAADAQWQSAVNNAGIAKDNADTQRSKPDRASAQEQPARNDQLLGPTAGDIRLAWSLSDSGAGFASALEHRGIMLAAVSREEAEASSRVAAFAKGLGRVAPSYTDGELVAVNGFGGVYRLDPHTTGDGGDEIASYLRTVDRSGLLNVTETREVMREASRATFMDELAAARPATAIERKIHDLSTGAKDESAFLKGLDDAGLALARATADDVSDLGREFALSFAATDKPVPTDWCWIAEGELVAVNSYGGIHRLNPHIVDGDLCEALVTDAGKAILSIGAERFTALEARADTTDHWNLIREARSAERMERATEANTDAGSEVEKPKDQGVDFGVGVLGGVSRALEGAARIVESLGDVLDTLTGGSPQPAPQPEKPPPAPEPQPLPVAEFPRASAPLDADTRREAVLRAIAEMESALRQEDERRDREAGRGLEIEREISR
jgi:hypothetical protein